MNAVFCNQAQTFIGGRSNQEITKLINTESNAATCNLDKVIAGKKIN